MLAKTSSYGRRGRRSTVILAALLVPAMLCGAAVQAEDDWPIRLRFSAPQGDSSGAHSVLTAENVADFRCTKLKLQITIDGGTLQKGGGHTSATLVGNALEYGGVPVLNPGQKIEWTVDFNPSSSVNRTKLTAELNFAEKEQLKAKPKPAPRRNCRDYQPSVGADMSVAELAFPTGNRNNSAVLVHQVMPREVDRNQVFTYEYHVTNLYDGELQNVELQAYSFRNLEVIEADPAGEPNADGFVWDLGDLGECETRIIKVKARSDELGNASACLAVSYANRLCAVTKVVEPGLKLVKTATPQMLLCDEGEIVLTVSNPGTGVARNVRLVDELPDGMVMSDGRTRVEGVAGDLAPGESKRLTFKFKTTRTGSFENTASALAEGGLTAESGTTTTVVRQPVLTIAASCPEERYIGRDAQFCFEVGNTGDTAAADSVLTATIPAGSEIVEIGNRGQQQGNNIVWQLGSLAPNDTREVCFVVRATQAATLRTTGRVAANCADPVEASCVTKVVGISAILLEVIDLEDPIEVGNNETYLITVTNQGTADDTNVQITVIFPEQQEFISATGATNGSVSGNTVTFAPLPRLDPKAEVVWRVTLRAAAPGDVRFAVEMNSDNLTSPVRETEATNLYK